MLRKDFIEKVTLFTRDKIPFIFAINYECDDFIVCELDSAKENGIWYEVNNNTNVTKKSLKKDIEINPYLIDKHIYKKYFKDIKWHLEHGDSYLLNLTLKTKIDINLTLEEIFYISKARYKLMVEDKFVVFSPECFIKIVDNKIFTYPMKGTIDASIINAKDVLINDKKEEMEHNTIVDLMRNDLSIIGTNTEVNRYRFVESIKTHRGEILQTSSEISANLKNNWEDNLGEMLLEILPAGSISGAPKQKTCEIIKKVENQKRGFYTGIFGIYDGKNIDSGVCIRYIEKIKDKIYFRSGGGITAYSNLDSEYNEVLQKIYVPTI